MVPIALSSSHIAFGSIRMEPVFMILAQSGATAAMIAIKDGTSLQEIEYAKLRERLLADKQVLEHESSRARRTSKRFRGSLSLNSKLRRSRQHPMLASSASSARCDGGCVTANAPSLRVSLLRDQPRPDGPGWLWISHFGL
ncbi:MAG: FAD-dependent oxidoreductase [Luteolibacter sp.]